MCVPQTVQATLTKTFSRAFDCNTTIIYLANLFYFWKNEWEINFQCFSGPMAKGRRGLVPSCFAQKMSFASIKKALFAFSFCFPFKNGSILFNHILTSARNINQLQNNKNKFPHPSSPFCSMLWASGWRLSGFSSAHTKMHLPTCRSGYGPVFYPVCTSTFAVFEIIFKNILIVLRSIWRTS